MDELLEKCKIDGVLLREIIVDPNTEIVTQDNEIDVDDLANLKIKTLQQVSSYGTVRAYIWKLS